MSYQVLARKYRPKNFSEVAGQEHVLKALVNALEQNRLHHAYLFTGTRGVGKTTIARILARCLNCDKGVTSEPCGICSSCMEISEGRSVDLIEVDAASRTKVEDTRELLDNVQYMPSHSRFKIYLIDEVHMLSNSSFNALLKTLEEPPEHVKFLLATTDPKKLPVTVLSRCLQFNLKNLTPERIVDCLRDVLTAEAVSFDEKALWHLGKAADGSMRDALSLTDQAISFSSNDLGEEAVRSMLGSMDHNEVLELLDALADSDGRKLLDKVASLSEFSPDYQALLASMLSVLHRIAVAQLVPDALDNSLGDREMLEDLAQRISREDIQLYYQIGLMGQKDIPYAPDPRSGLEMILLRMLAFEPIGPTDVNTSNGSPVREDVTSVRSSGDLSSDKADAPASAKKKTQLTELITQGKLSSPARLALQAIDMPKPVVSEVVPETGTRESLSVVPAADKVVKDDSVKQNVSLDVPWKVLLETLSLEGITRTLAMNSVLEKSDGSEWLLLLSQQHESLWNQEHELRIGRAISMHAGRDINVKIEIGNPSCETPAEALNREMQERQSRAETAIETDVNVQTLIERFEGRINKKSIRPILNESDSSNENFGGEKQDKGEKNGR